MQRLEFHVDPDRKFKDPVLEDTAIAEAQVAASEDPPTPVGGGRHSPPTGSAYLAKLLEILLDIFHHSVRR